MSKRAMVAASSVTHAASLAPGARGVGWRRLRSRVPALAVLAALMLEGAGRLAGLHTPVIYEKTTYGYRAVPNQDLHRFGNRSFYNAQGLRSEPIGPGVAPGTLRVLCLGDSVINGGAITDQAATIPYQLQDLLRLHFKSVEVLNASAPGWAVANELGWLREHGILHSGLVLLTISSHDLFQQMAPSGIVGMHPSFPQSRPLLALQDAVQHYILPRLLPAAQSADPGAAGVHASAAQAAWNRDAILAIERIVRQQGGKLAVLLLEQRGAGVADTATAEAGRLLFAALADRGVSALTLDAEIGQIGRGALYRDDVHPNPVGNQVIAVAMVRKVLELATDVAGGSAAGSPAAAERP
jgi:lysophospholipase L1-like esterase